MADAIPLVSRVRLCFLAARQRIVDSGHGALPPTPIVDAASLRAKCRHENRRDGTSLFEAALEGERSIVKVWRDSPLITEQARTVAAGLALSDHQDLRASPRLCLPRAIAFDAEADEVLAMFDALAEPVADALERIRQSNEPRRLGEAIGTILLGAAKGLAEVHDAGFIHGDVSPRNLMLRNAGDPRSVCWIDFDLAQRHGIGQRPDRVGTPWCSPDEWLDFRAVPPRTTEIDVAAFAEVIAMEVFGYKPFSNAPDEIALRSRQAFRAQRELGEIASSLGLRGLDEVLRRAAGQDRYRSSVDLYGDLERVVSGKWRTSTPMRRRWKAIAISASRATFRVVFAVAVLTGAFHIGRLWERARPQPATSWSILPRLREGFFRYATNDSISLARKPEDVGTTTWTLAGVETYETPPPHTEFDHDEPEHWLYRLLNGERIRANPVKVYRNGNRPPAALVYRMRDRALVNELLISAGYACATDYGFDLGPGVLERLRAAERRAELNRRGLWEGTGPGLPCMTVYVDDETVWYHRAHCRMARGAMSEERLSVALRSHRPCRICKPPWYPRWRESTSECE